MVVVVVFVRGSHRTEVGVVSDVLSHARLGGRQRHDEQQGVSGLLAHQTLPETQTFNQNWTHSAEPFVCLFVYL